MQDEKNKIERKKNKREIEVTALPKGRAAYWRYPEGAVRLNHLTAPMPDGASSHTHTKSEFSQAQGGGTAPTQGPTVQGDSTHPPWGQLVQAEGEDRGDPGLSLCLSPGHRDPKEQGGGLRRVMGELRRVMRGVRG